MSDSMVCKIKNPKMFVPQAEGGQPLDPKLATVVSDVPAQVPKGVNATELDNQAAQAGNAMQTLAIVQLVSAVFMKGAMNDLMGLFFTLQIICYMKLYDTPLPSNTDVYISEFTKLIEFQALNPDKALKAFWPDFDLWAWVA